MSDRHCKRLVRPSRMNCWHGISAMFARLRLEHKRASHRRKQSETIDVSDKASSHCCEQRSLQRSTREEICAMQTASDCICANRLTPPTEQCGD